MCLQRHYPTCGLSDRKEPVVKRFGSGRSGQGEQNTLRRSGCGYRFKKRPVAQRHSDAVRRAERPSVRGRRTSLWTGRISECMKSHWRFQVQNCHVGIYMFFKDHSRCCMEN